MGTALLSTMNRYDIIMSNDVAMDHYDTMLNNDVAMDIHYDIILSNGVTMDIHYDITYKLLWLHTMMSQWILIW